MNYAEDRLDRKVRHSTSEGGSLLEKDLAKAHELIKTSTPYSQFQGHELAGRTMRDAGLSPQATFHFGMAWILSFNIDGKDEDCSGDSELKLTLQEKSVGDYAQMVELAGFPDIAAIILLFHMNGGCIEKYESKISHTVESSDFILENDSTNRFHQNCGCGLDRCGTSCCFIPEEIASSQVFQIQMNSFEYLQSNIRISRNREETTAGDIIESVTKATQKKNPVVVSPKCPDYIPITLRFWSCDIQRPLPPLLQILLLKQLYSAPIGSSFLILATEALRHLAIHLPLSSKIGRKMAQLYKSHWAYYLLIHKIVLGERIKMSRRNLIPYHVPIWDLQKLLDNRKCYDLDNHRFITKENDSLMHYIHKTLSELIKKNNAIEMKYPLPRFPQYQCRNFIYAIGDSHCLSIGWQNLHIEKNGIHKYRTIVPCPTTGLKAWHTRPTTKFFTKYNLDQVLRRLPEACKTIILSAGEIDCREGIGGTQLEGYSDGCNEAVRNTVDEYVNSVLLLSKTHDLQILLLPVAPHAYRSSKNGKSLGRSLRRQRMLLWNETLREKCNQINTMKGDKVFLLDYEEGLREDDVESPVGFVLNKHYNADFTHMNSAFLPLLEKSIEESDCNFDFI